jgi:Leucine-rich repeat (LRR) protein
LSSNKIRNVEYIDFETLVHLNLSNNKLARFEYDFFRNCYDFLLAVQQIDLSRNRFESLNVSLYRLVNLEYLNLAHNRLTILRGNLFVNQKILKKLDLSQNRLTFLNSSLFSSFNYLTFLNLSSNLDGSMHSNQFSALVSLVYLDLSNNSVNKFNKPEKVVYTFKRV